MKKTVQIKHSISERIRFKVYAIRFDKDASFRLEEYFRSIKGVKWVKANPKSASLVIRHDKKILTTKDIVSIVIKLFSQHEKSIPAEKTGCVKELLHEKKNPLKLSLLSFMGLSFLTLVVFVREILLKNDPWLSYWVSEPDHGIYDAMDKGVEASNGEWLYFLGVDDAFYSRETLSSIFEGRTLPKSLDTVVGHVYTDRGLFCSRFNGSLLYKNTVYHQAAFYARHIFDHFRYCSPPFSNRHKRYYRISGDYRLNLMLYRWGAKHMRVNLPVARCRTGISMQGKMRGYLEEIRIRHEYVTFHKAIFFDVFTILRYLYKHSLKTG